MTNKPRFEVTETHITARIRDSTTFGQIRDLEDQLHRICHPTVDISYLRMHILNDPEGEKKAVEILSACDLLCDVTVSSQCTTYTQDTYREGVE